MTVTSSQAAAAVEAAAETWGSRRRTPPRADVLSLDGIVGSALDVLGLLPLVPVADRSPRESIAAVIAMAPELALHLEPNAVHVLAAAQVHEARGRNWGDCARVARAYATDVEAVALAAEQTGDQLRVVHVRTPRRDDLTPCPAQSEPLRVIGDVAVVFGCADTDGHHPERAHVWAMTW